MTLLLLRLNGFHLSSPAVDGVGGLFKVKKLDGNLTIAASFPTIFK